MERWWNNTDRVKQKYSEKSMTRLHGVITNRTLTDLGSNPGFCDERPAINRLRHGVASSRSVSYVRFVCISYLLACCMSVRQVIDLLMLLQYSVNG
jgi:hypothetical protein